MKNLSPTKPRSWCQNAWGLPGDREAWRAVVRGAAESPAQLGDEAQPSPGNEVWRRLGMSPLGGGRCRRPERRGQGCAKHPALLGAAPAGRDCPPQSAQAAFEKPGSRRMSRMSRVILQSRKEDFSPFYVLRCSFRGAPGSVVCTL